MELATTWRHTKAVKLEFDIFTPTIQWSLLRKPVHIIIYISCLFERMFAIGLVVENLLFCWIVAFTGYVQTNFRFDK